MTRGFGISRVARVAACGTAIAAMVVAAGAPAGAAMSPNLLKNGTAEAAAGGTGGVVNVPGWTRETGTDFTAVKYGSPNFPSTTAPAPPNRGKNFFAGGPADSTFPDQVAVQNISLSKYVTKIKGGKVTFTIAGWFGGNGRSKDAALMEVDFKNASGGLISGGKTVGNVTEAQRGGKTELLHRLTTAKVPAGARSVFVQLIFDGSGTGYNNGYADNVTLTLSGV
ncbi:MAG TPA: hypothetical protein VGO03_09745 [Acidimicrobiia bacterium]